MALKGTFFFGLIFLISLILIGSARDAVASDDLEASKVSNLGVDLAAAAAGTEIENQPETSIPESETETSQNFETVPKVSDIGVKSGATILSEKMHDSTHKYRISLLENKTLTVNQFEARHYVDKGWQVHTEEADKAFNVDVEMIIPHGLRNGLIGTYQVQYQIESDDTNSLAEKVHRTVIVVDVDECKLTCDARSIKQTVQCQHDHKGRLVRGLINIGQQECPEHSFCLNTDGDFICECSEGWRKHTNTKFGRCVDVDECAEKTDQCHPNARCTNTIFSTKLERGYNCSCSDGYEGDGFVECKDINECEKIKAGDKKYTPCHPHAECVNTLFSSETRRGYDCKCKEEEGWFPFPDGFNCKGECTEKAGCDENAYCVRDQPTGNFECSCKPGFKGDGKTCVDVDECTDGISTVRNGVTTHVAACHPKATCSNTVGSYECKCNEGYKGDGKNCVDIDECEEKANPCPRNFQCINLDGSYNCTCPPPFVLEGEKCVDTEAPSLALIGDNPLILKQFSTFLEPGYNISDERQAEENLRLIINVPSKLTDKYLHHVGWFEITYKVKNIKKPQKPYAVGTRVVIVEDIDECSLPEYDEFRYVCPDHSQCRNTNGSYVCECKSGFTAEYFANGTIHRCRDNEKPVITLLGNNPVYLLRCKVCSVSLDSNAEQYDESKHGGIQVIDNSDGDISDTVEITRTETVNGTFYVFYNARDAEGNEADTVNRTVSEKHEDVYQVIMTLKEEYDRRQKVSEAQLSLLASDNYWLRWIYYVILNAVTLAGIIVLVLEGHKIFRTFLIVFGLGHLIRNFRDFEEAHNLYLRVFYPTLSTTERAQRTHIQWTNRHDKHDHAE